MHCGGLQRPRSGLRNPAATQRVNSLDAAEYTQHRFQELSLPGVVTSNRLFSRCQFHGCDFRDSVWETCEFYDCLFERCDFSLANWGYSKLEDVSFQECKLLGVDWAKVNWPSFISNPSVGFQHCLLNDASFFDLALAEVSFTNCRALGTDFRQANLSGADFSSSDLSGASFGNTNLTNANFAGATNYDINVQSNKVQGARFDRLEATRLLAGFGIRFTD